MKKGIQSLETGLGILGLLAQGKGPVSAKSLAALARMSPSKLQFYLTSLLRCGAVEQDREGGKFDLGPFVLALGLAKIGQLDVVQRAQPYLERLGENVGYPAYLSVWGNRGPTIVRWAEGRRDLVLEFRAGWVLPLLRSATGRIFVAHLPQRKTATLARAEWRNYRSRRSSLATFLNEIALSVRTNGIAITRGEIVSGIGAVAGPVFDSDGHLAAALTTVLPTADADLSPDGRIAVAVRTAAQRLSREMGLSAAT